jgi:HEAT repeat protein
VVDGDQPFDPDPDETTVSHRPVAEVLDDLERGESVDYDDLRALSEPPDEIVARLLGIWPKLPAERRREVLATLQHLAAEDATLDFHRAHLSALRDTDPATRILAVRGMWEQEREDYMQLFLEQLKTDPEPSVREAVAEVLGAYVVSMEFGVLTEEAADDLSSALREVVDDVNEHEGVRSAALTALGPSSEDWVAELIGEHYETGGPRMRIASLLAMGRNADDEWLPVILHNFGDDDPEVRAAAAVATGQLLLEEAIDPLLQLIDDDDEEVQVAAVRAIGEIAGEGAERVLADLMGRREEHIREAARQALAGAQLIAFESVEGNEPPEPPASYSNGGNGLDGTGPESDL